MDKKKWVGFLIAEGVLLAAAAFYRFVLLVYTTLALCCLFAAFVALLYFLLDRLGQKKPRPAKTLRIVLTVLLAAGFALFAAAETTVVRGAHTDTNSEAPYCIVLGAKVNGETPTLSLEERLIAAKDYLETYPAAKAVLSGGQGPGEGISEAEAMRRYLTQAGIAPDRLLLEDRSTTTEENIANSLAVVRANGGDPSGRVAIVSSEYHLCRARRIGAANGCVPIGVAAHTGWPVLRLNYFVREAFGMAWQWAAR